MQMLSVNPACPRPVSPVFIPQPQPAQAHHSVRKTVYLCLKISFQIYFNLTRFFQVFTYVVPSHHGSAGDMTQPCSSQSYMDPSYGTPVQFQQPMQYYSSPVYAEPSGTPTHVQVGSCLSMSVGFVNVSVTDGLLPEFPHCLSCLLSGTDGGPSRISVPLWIAVNSYTWAAIVRCRVESVADAVHTTTPCQLRAKHW